MCKAVKQEETVNPKLISHGSVCVACGEQVPEGTMICNNCKDKYKKEDMAGYNEIIDDIVSQIPSADNSDIDDFSGRYYFLSNFYVTNFTYNSMTFTNTEAAFHSMKCPERAEEFCNLSPSAAKKLGRQVKLRADWEEIKKQVMHDVCLAKFSQNKDLKEKLLATGNRTLIEGNFWNDKCWGVCNGEGENNLGKILMKIRGELNKNI